MGEVEEKMYTNQESVWAAKIAYLDITDKLLEDFYRDTLIIEPNFSQLCDYCIDKKIKM